MASLHSLCGSSTSSPVRISAITALQSLAARFDADTASSAVLDALKVALAKDRSAPVCVAALQCYAAVSEVAGWEATCRLILPKVVFLVAEPGLTAADLDAFEVAVAVRDGALQQRTRAARRAPRFGAGLTLRAARRA